MRTSSWLAVFSLFLGACASVGEANPPSPDTGTDTGTDVGTDTGTTPVTDAPPTDTGAPLDAGADVPADTGALDVTSPLDVPPRDGSLLPPLDAGEPFTDGGALGEPAWVSLEVRTTGACTPLTACGGTETGTWDVSGGCVELPIPPQLMSCPGASVTRTAGRARGRVTFASGFANRTAQWSVEAEVFVPSLCASFVGGCSGLQGLIRPSIPDSVCATEGAGDCRCGVRQSGMIRDADGYSTMSNQIVSTTLGRRWDYCVEGTRLRYRDVSATGAREPGIIELTRRSP